MIVSLGMKHLQNPPQDLSLASSLSYPDSFCCLLWSSWSMEGDRRQVSLRAGCACTGCGSSFASTCDFSLFYSCSQHGGPDSFLVYFCLTLLHKYLEMYNLAEIAKLVRSAPPASPHRLQHPTAYIIKSRCQSASKWPTWFGKGFWDLQPKIAKWIFWFKHSF